MIGIATCAKCGEEKGLCESGRMNGIKQPRICKDCLLLSMQSGDYETNDAYWIKQILQLGDMETIEKWRDMQSTLTD